MRRLAAICLLVSSTAGFGAEVEIATLLGQPDGNLDFTSEIVKESIDLVSGDNFIGTAYYSILARRDVRSAASVRIVSDQGSSTYETVLKGLKLASSKARVVVSYVGPNSKATCTEMAAQDQSVFVIAAQDSLPTECNAANVVTVAVLNKSRSDLNNSFVFDSAKIAAAGTEIRGIESGNKLVQMTSRGAAESLVAAHLVQLARKDGSLKGSELANKLYSERTIKLSTIEGKVEMGRALDDTGY